MNTTTNTSTELAPTCSADAARTELAPVDEIQYGQLAYSDPIAEIPEREVTFWQSRRDSCRRGERSARSGRDHCRSDPAAQAVAGPRTRVGGRSHDHDLASGVSWSQEVMKVQAKGFSISQAERIVTNIQNDVCPGVSAGQPTPQAGFIDFGDGSWS